MKFLNKIFFYLVTLLVLIIIILGLYYFLILKPAGQLAESVGQLAAKFEESFNFKPRIIIDNKIVISENSPVLEIAFVSQQIDQTYKYQNSWLGSTKTFELEGRYTAKYGFDLKSQKFQIQIQPVSDSLLYSISLPRILLLSIETSNYVITQDRSGWWNRIDVKERNNALNNMLKQAKIKASSIENIRSVKHTLEQILSTFLLEQSPPGKKIKIIFQWDPAIEMNQLVN